MAGATGLDYSAVYPLIDRMNLAPAEWDQMLADIKTMEIAALEQMRAEHQ